LRWPLQYAHSNNVCLTVSKPIWQCWLRALLAQFTLCGSNHGPHDVMSYDKCTLDMVLPSHLSKSGIAQGVIAHFLVDGHLSNQRRFVALLSALLMTAMVGRGSLGPGMVLKTKKVRRCHTGQQQSSFVRHCSVFYMPDHPQGGYPRSVSGLV